MNEADRKREFVRDIKTLGGYARRIEDSWAVGVLDLIIKLPGVPLILAEGKIIKGNLFGPTPAQFAEGEKWIRAGVDAILIGWQLDGTMHISPWVKQANRHDCWASYNGNEAEFLLKYLSEMQIAKNQDSKMA